jgi:hypothetical protein
VKVVGLLRIVADGEVLRHAHGTATAADGSSRVMIERDQAAELESRRLTMDLYGLCWSRLPRRMDA